MTPVPTQYRHYYLKVPIKDTTTLPLRYILYLTYWPMVTGVLYFTPLEGGTQLPLTGVAFYGGHCSGTRCDWRPFLWSDKTGGARHGKLFIVDDVV
jgi:hypothetical protein